jgi:dTDP-4-dehydrorhamnose reductase
VLVIGGAGMLGHKLWQVLRPRFDVFVTVRKAAGDYEGFKLFDTERVLGGVDVRRPDDLLAAFAWCRPDVVVNAAGIVKQREAAEDPIQSLEINALFPHRLAMLCRARETRLIHFSTDCVFSGKAGGYTEDSPSDATDLYGRTKLLGEVTTGGALTLRTSMIGRELETRRGLLEWFLGQRRGRCRGYARTVFSGLTTESLAAVVADVAERHPSLAGLYHVSAAPICKYDLLRLINEAYRLGVAIEEDDTLVCDRSLDSTRFRQATGWRPESWERMIATMRDDTTPYDAWAEGTRAYAP